MMNGRALIRMCSAGALLLSSLHLTSTAAAQAAGAGAGAPQERDEETIKIRTREVFIDVLVKDKRTGAPVADLSQENFEVFDDGRPRKLSYFSRAGQARKRPLALVLLLDLRPGGAGRFLRRPEFVASLAAALRGLPPQDEVGVLATSVDGEWGKRRWLVGLTRDRDAVSRALAAVPELVGEKKVYRKEYENSFGEALEEVGGLAAEARPQSQVALVLVSDGVNGLDSLFYEQRDRMGDGLLRANLIFNALTHDMQAKSKAVAVASKPVFLLARASLAGNEQHFARLTGGEAVGVDGPEEYAGGLERIVRSLTARYSLGFTLDEGERNDGRLHRLEVRVEAREPGGKKRKLEVRARRGYYLPQAVEP